jgi:hypothetical protein
MLFDAPPSWRYEHEENWTLLASPDRRIVITATPLVDRELDARTIFEADLDVPVTYLSWREARTVSGSPMALVTLIAGREYRLAVIYTMQSQRAVLVACGPKDALVANIELLRALFASARPHRLSSRRTSPSLH